MKWKEKYDIEQLIEFSRLNLLDYVTYINGNLNVSLDENIAIAGNMGLSGYFNVTVSPDKQLYLYSSSFFKPRIDYFTSSGEIKPFFFTNSPIILLTNALLTNSQQNFEQIDIGVKPFNKDGIIQVKMSEKPELPSFNTIWNAYYPYRDDLWLINDYGFSGSINIINPVSSEKELIAFGDEYSTSFECRAESNRNVYIKKNVKEKRFQDITSREYSYYYGENINIFFNFDKRKLNLKASSNPVLLNLPESAYQTFGNYSLSGKDWSVLSGNEKIDSIYFNRPTLIYRLMEGIDYRYNPGLKTIDILSEKFYRDNTFLLGTGDGQTDFFRFNHISGDFFIYIGNKRTASFSFSNGIVSFNTPPENGKEIKAFTIPKLYIKKSPPDKNTGIFIDKTDKAIILDLNLIQNCPANGVILSYLPLLVRGTSLYPLVIISTENIYLEEINSYNKGEPVFFVSGKGVWIYEKANKTNKQIDNISNLIANRIVNHIDRCVIYTPLKGLYTVTEAGEMGKNPASIYGSVIFSFENEKGTMDWNFFQNNYIYYSRITNYINRMPFSIFPFPFSIEKVRRS